MINANLAIKKCIPEFSMKKVKNKFFYKNKVNEVISIKHLAYKEDSKTNYVIILSKRISSSKDIDSFVTVIYISFSNIGQASVLGSSNNKNKLYFNLNSFFKQKYTVKQEIVFRKRDYNKIQQKMILEQL